LENDELEELTNDIRRLIESNKAFLERVNDEDYDEDFEEDEEDEEDDLGADGDPDHFEEL
jgi:hypothetical protein